MQAEAEESIPAACAEHSVRWQSLDQGEVQGTGCCYGEISNVYGADLDVELVLCTLGHGREVVRRQQVHVRQACLLELAQVTAQRNRMEHELQDSGQGQATLLVEIIPCASCGQRILCLQSGDHDQRSVNQLEQLSVLSVANRKLSCRSFLGLAGHQSTRPAGFSHGQGSARVELHVTPDTGTGALGKRQVFPAEQRWHRLV